MGVTLILVTIIAAAVGYWWINKVKRGPMYKSNKSLTGKTVLITGGHNGIGKITAIEMAKKGARVIIASMHIHLSEAAMDEIKRESGNDNIRAMKLDLIDFDSVRSFVKEFNKTEQYLDFLVNNSAAVICGRTDYGVSKIFAVNHYGPFLLTNLLLRKMKAQSKSRPVRIMNIVDANYKLGSLSKEKMCTNPISFIERLRTFADAEFAIVVFTQELHRRLKNNNITSYSIFPGPVDNGPMDKNAFPKIFTIPMEWVLRPIYARPIIYACQTILYCALDDEVTKYSGGFFSECAKKKMTESAGDKKTGKFLWQNSLKVTGLDTT